MLKTKILIVEDERITAKVIERVLQHLGYEVTAIAKSGSGALSQIKKNPPDLVLMDITLRDKMDGIETADLIRIRFDIPVVYLTALTDEATLDKIKETEPFGYITKPFDSKELHGVIETSLHKHGIEKKLRDSEELYRSLFENSPLGLCITDENGKLITYNDAMLRPGGYNREDINRIKNVAILYYDSDERSKIMKIARKQGFVDQIGVQFKRKDGTPYNALLSLRPVQIEGQICWQAMIEDLTEHKQAEEALRESEERFSLFMDYIPAVIFIKDKESKALFVNKYMNDVLGAKEWIDKPLDKILPPDLAKKMHEDDSKALSEGYRMLVENVPDKNGVELIFETSKFRIERSNKPPLLGGIAMDITERKRAEEALKKSSIASETSMSAIFTADLKGIITYANTSAAKMWVYKNTEEMIGTNATEYWTESTRGKAVEMIGTLLKEGYVATSGELIGKRLDGTEFIVESNSVVIRDEKGNPAGLIGSFSDITERKQAEEQIKKDLKEKQILLKEIHHRVKNNLQVISSLLGLQAKHIKDKKVLDMFKESKNRIRSMALVHEELYRSGDLANIDFTKYIHELVDRIGRTYIMKPDRIEFKVEVKDVFLVIDLAISCGLVINELISNALKHAFPPSFKGKGKIEIAVHPTEAGEIELIVNDNGVGIPKELDIRKTESLGMQLVFILAEDQLDGEVTLDRSGGTKFTIRFKQE